MKKKSDKMSDRYTNEITRLHHELTEKVVEKMHYLIENAIHEMQIPKLNVVC